MLLNILLDLLLNVLLLAGLCNILFLLDLLFLDLLLLDLLLDLLLLLLATRAIGLNVLTLLDRANRESSSSADSESLLESAWVPFPLPGLNLRLANNHFLCAASERVVSKSGMPSLES
jgi:hypothetical protein